MLTDQAKALLARKGYDPQLGARPLRRAIQRMLEDPLSEKVLFHEFAAGSTILVDVDPEDELRPHLRGPVTAPDRPPVETGRRLPSPGGRRPDDNGSQCRLDSTTASMADVGRSEEEPDSMTRRRLALVALLRCLR